MLGGADNPNGELPSYITGANTLPLSVPVESLPRTAAPSGHNGRRQPLTHGNSAETAHKTLLPRVMHLRQTPVL